MREVACRWASKDFLSVCLRREQRAHRRSRLAFARFEPKQGGEGVPIDLNPSEGDVERQQASERH